MTVLVDHDICRSGLGGHAIASGDRILGRPDSADTIDRARVAFKQDRRLRRGVPLFAGNVLLRDRVEHGWMHVESGRIVDCGLGEPPEPVAATGWITPMAVNAHTHAADTFLRDRPGKPRELGPLVGPGGWKHRHLAQASRDDIVAGVERLAAEAAAAGAEAMLDFREGGTAGLESARQAEPALDAHWYGRPATNTFDEDEAQAVLEVADGIGLSAMRDFPRRRDVEAWAEAAHAARRPFALHAAEGSPEDMDAILALAPAFLVHCVHVRRPGLDAIAEQDVPVVVCPRSNRSFGLKPPVSVMLEAGIDVALGTDNGMLQDGNIWNEAAVLRAWFGIPDETLLRMATYNGWRALGAPPPRFSKGEPARWLVLPADPIPRVDAGRPVLAPVQDRPAPTDADGASAAGGST